MESEMELHNHILATLLLFSMQCKHVDIRCNLHVQLFFTLSQILTSLYYFFFQYLWSFLVFFFFFFFFLTTVNPRWRLFGYRRILMSKEVLFDEPAYPVYLDIVEVTRGRGTREFEERRN